MSNEEKNRKVGAVISGVFHLVLLLAFLFIIAWKEPDPPIPQYGIELNFGLDNTGSGEVQPQTPVRPTPIEEEAAPEETPQETPEEVVENIEPVEEITETTPEAVQTTDNVQESPDVVAKTPVESKQPVEEPVKEKDNEPKPAEQQPAEQPKQGAQGNEGDNTAVQNANQGDNLDEEGDKGNEQGTLDSRALYGEPGGGGGSSLEMTGWIWDFKPKPNDTSNENGRIVFEIRIDDQGEIISVRTLERSVSPAVEKVYRQEVEKLTFSKTSDNSITAAVSTGRITFVIKSK